MKKRLFTVGLITISFLLFGQTIIGKKTAPSSPSSLLEFDDTKNAGLVLPYIYGEATVVSPVAGTLIFDYTTKKIKLRDNTGWKDLTSTANNSNAISPTIINAQNALTEDAGRKTVIGSKTSAANGVLVLESPNKTMILPKVTNPAGTIANPSAGMIVYDPTNDYIATFNGTQWTFWK